MHLESGALHVGGTMAYVPQTPWVQNLTLKDNIIFGLPFDEDKYKKVRAAPEPSLGGERGSCAPAVLRVLGPPRGPATGVHICRVASKDEPLDSGAW
jgi:hypothetical protein